MGVNTAEVGLVYDALEKKIKGTVDHFFESYDLSGEDKAQVVSSTINTLIVKAIDSVQRQEVQDPQVSLLNATNPDKIAIQGYTKNIKQVESEIATGTKANKIALVQEQLDKIIADRNYVIEQKAQLSASVGYNNKIKALDSFGDLFGTLGAAGLVVPDEGWKFLSDIGNDLTGQTLTSTGFATGVTRPA